MKCSACGRVTDFAALGWRCLLCKQASSTAHLSHVRYCYRCAMARALCLPLICVAAYGAACDIANLVHRKPDKSCQISTRCGQFDVVLGDDVGDDFLCSVMATGEGYDCVAPYSGRGPIWIRHDDPEIQAAWVARVATLRGAP